MITYTVEGLNPSSDPVPHSGQLYEATVTVDTRGAVPMVSMFNARAESGANYRVIGGAVRDILAWVPGAPQEGTRP